MLVDGYEFSLYGHYSFKKFELEMTKVPDSVEVGTVIEKNLSPFIARCIFDTLEGITKIDEAVVELGRKIANDSGGVVSRRRFVVKHLEDSEYEDDRYLVYDSEKENSLNFKSLNYLFPVGFNSNYEVFTNFESLFLKNALKILIEDRKNKEKNKVYNKIKEDYC